MGPHIVESLSELKYILTVAGERERERERIKIHLTETLTVALVFFFKGN